MSFSIEVNVPTEVVNNWPDALRMAGPEWLEAFGRHMVARSGETFDRLAYGGTYRGVTWPAFLRKPSARRGGWGARLLDDTGKLKSSVGEISRIEGDRVIVGTGVPYAARQQRMRPFLFFDGVEDVSSAKRIASSFIKKALSSDE